MAHGARVHECGEEGGEVTITLPGPPVAYAVEPAAVVAHLFTRGWREQPEAHPAFRLFASGRHMIAVPIAGGDMADRMTGMLYQLADLEERPATVIAAELSKREEGPALQWAHASADTRAPVLALLDREARWERSDATRCRNNDEPELALAAEGRAMAHEAAAAVLRGGGRG